MWYMYRSVKNTPYFTLFGLSILIDDYVFIMYFACMYVYVCMYVCMYVRTYVRTYVRLYVCMYV